MSDLPGRNITDRQIKAFGRFVELLPHGKDMELVILKAHLLIEEQVNLLIERRLKNISALDEAKLGSFHRICLAESFFSVGFQPWLWDGLKRLNRLRNQIAHRLTHHGIEDAVDRFIESFPGDFGMLAPERQARFQFTLWSMFDAVSELVELGNDSISE